MHDDNGIRKENRFKNRYSHLRRKLVSYFPRKLNNTKKINCEKVAVKGRES